MSIIYCDKHDRQWDSDKLDECPMCENEPYEHPNSRSRMKRIAMQCGPPTVQETTCEETGEPHLFNQDGEPWCDVKGRLDKYCSIDECERKERGGVRCVIHPRNKQ